jgi:hypothetical protein
MMWELSRKEISRKGGALSPHGAETDAKGGAG